MAIFKGPNFVLKQSCMIQHRFQSATAAQTKNQLFFSCQHKNSPFFSFMNLTNNHSQSTAAHSGTNARQFWLMSELEVDEADQGKESSTNMGNKVIQNVVTQIEKCERDENSERARVEEESTSDQENTASDSVSDHLKLSSSSSASTSSAVSPRRKPVLTPSNKKDDSGYLPTASSDSSQATPATSCRTHHHHETT
ncbi:hypothetical protein BpHYR1_035348, partial [Brachionus plicatilis]